jgi:GNAT superfamily N-acetyltransferase
MPVIIRKMQASDYSQAIALLKRWNIAPIAPSPDLPNPERDDLIVENAHVAVDDERIVGVVSFFQISPSVAEGASFALDPEYHGRGIARRLGDANLREQYRRGVRVLREETDRPEAMRWLLERGHRVIGTTPKRHPFGLPNVDHWTVFELDLKPPPDEPETA